MNTVEYVSIAIAIAVMAARIIMFFPRSGKNNAATAA